MDVQGQRFLSDQECWELWIKPGMSLLKVQQVLLNKGTVNPSTGEPPRIQSIEKAAFRYLVESPKEIQDQCRKQYEYGLATMQAKTLSDEEWKKFLVAKARFVYQAQKKRYESFIARNGLQSHDPGW